MPLSKNKISLILLSLSLSPLLSLSSLLPLSLSPLLSLSLSLLPLPLPLSFTGQVDSTGGPLTLLQEVPLNYTQALGLGTPHYLPPIEQVSLPLYSSLTLHYSPFLLETYFTPTSFVHSFLSFTPLAYLAFKVTSTKQLSSNYLF